MRDLPIFKKYYFDVFIACKGCGLVPIHGNLNDYGLCCGCHLYSDGDGSICNACVRKSTQHGGATAYKALCDTIEEHVIDGGDDQSLEFFIYSNDETIRHILQDAIDIHR